MEGGGTVSFDEQVITIAIAALATMATRFVPFLLFPDPDTAPVFVTRLGEFLPPAIFGILVVYCYQDELTQLSATTVIAVVAGLATAGIQWWRKNMLLSIVVGTVLYIGLLQLV